MDHTKAKLVKCIKSGNMFMFSNSESNVMDANYSCLVDKESLPIGISEVTLVFLGRLKRKLIF